MLDENDTPTTEGPRTTSTTRPRRRAAGRPAGPPAPVSAEVPSAPEVAPPPVPDAPTEPSEDASRSAKKSAKRPAAKRAAKKVEPPAESTVDELPLESDPPVVDDVPATEGLEEDPDVVEEPVGETPPPARRPLAGGLMFQAPEPVAATSRRRRPEPEPAIETDELDLDEDDAAKAADVPASETDQDADDSEESEDTEGGPRRRRRSRGGRRRRKPESEESGSSDEDAESAAGSDDVESEDDGTGPSRRRRSRRRAGEGAGSPDDPENTVVKVREGRSADDEITSVAGSTRLEAKKQRRREGREAGRRRAPIVSESEFLARRESVHRQMVVRQHDDYTQIAVLEDKVLVEHYVARESQTSLIGNVYLGRVQNVLPSMEAAFIDIGAGRNAVLYAGEVDWSSHTGGKQRKIEDVLSSGQTILVQVSKDPVGAKGARLTSQISLPGRFLVYVPNGQTSGISRKLPDTERGRLKALLKEVLPENAGVIVRTAAEGATEDQLTRDVTALRARWEDIERKVEAGRSPELLYSEPDLMIKVVRDLFNEDFAQLVVEGSDAWDNISGYVQHVASDLADRLERWEPADDGPADAFSAFRIDEQIVKALDRKVWLPSGGSLVIDRTEAMTVVDVNTGKFTGSGGNLEETVTKNNLEAAEEIVRQLRLRDIGGIIVIDFIDMVLESNRELVLRRLVECLGRDRTRHQVAEVTSLGLVQMTRKRIGTGLVESFSVDCEHCKGRGIVIQAEPIEPKKDDGRARGGRGGRGGRSGRSDGQQGSNDVKGGGEGGNGNGNGNGNGRSRNRGGRGAAAATADDTEPLAEVTDTPTEFVEDQVPVASPIEDAPMPESAEVEGPAIDPADEASSDQTPVLTEEGQSP